MAVEHKEPKSNALFWVGIFVVSFCFQGMLLFLGSTASHCLALQGYLFGLSFPKLSHCTLIPLT